MKKDEIHGIIRCQISERELCFSTRINCKRGLSMKIQVGTVLELESTSYIIREQIDESGNSTVWKAEASGDSCIYAIKVLNEETSRHNEKLIRFDRECQFCKDTYNMHIVKVFDYVAEKGKAYCVMPYYYLYMVSLNDWLEYMDFIATDYVVKMDTHYNVHKKDYVYTKKTRG